MSDEEFLAHMSPWRVRLCPDCSWWAHHHASRDGDTCPDCKTIHSRRVELIPAMLHVTPMEATR